jgi:hypothetical protein
VRPPRLAAPISRGIATAPLLVLVFFTAWGCGGGEPEATYRGETTAAWTLKLQDADPATRLEALAALQAIGAPAREAVPDIVGLLDTGDPEVRVASVKALTAIGESSDDVTDAFIRHLVDEDLDLWNRERTEWAADLVDGLADEPAASAIEVYVGAGPLSHCSITTHGLVTVGATDAIPELNRVIREDAEGDEGARCAIYAAKALGLLGDAGDARAALEAIEPGLEHTKGFVRADAVRAIGDIGWVRAGAQEADWENTGERSAKILTTAQPAVAQGLNAEWSENVDQAMQDAVLQLDQYGVEVPSDLVAQFRGGASGASARSNAPSESGSGGAPTTLRVSGSWSVHEIRLIGESGSVRGGSLQFMGEADCGQRTVAAWRSSIPSDGGREEDEGVWCQSGAWLILGQDDSSPPEMRCGVEPWTGQGLILDCRAIAEDLGPESMNSIGSWRTEDEGFQVWLEPTG